MDVDQLLENLRADLPRISSEQRLEYIKLRISLIEDPQEKNRAENLFFAFQMANQSPIPKDVVVLIHGIRTHASWHDAVKGEIEATSNAIVYPIGYGYFDTLRFWFPVFFRKKPIEKIARELRVINQDNPDSRVLVIAHSFGTYIISKIMDDQRDIRVHRLLLCGSIISNDFRWDKLEKLALGDVLNDCGSKDVWPVLAKSTTWGYGSTGTFGFQSSKVRDRYNNFGHNGFFNKNYILNCWIPFVLSGQVVNSGYAREKTPLVLSFLTIPFKYLIFPLLILFLVRSLVWAFDHIHTLLNGLLFLV